MKNLLLILLLGPFLTQAQIKPALIIKGNSKANSDSTAPSGYVTRYKHKVDSSLFRSLMGGSGTVTSVSLSMPGVVFNTSVTGSPITTNGTLSPTLATQTANALLAGPASGAAASPTFRALVNADIPFTQIDTPLRAYTGTITFTNASGTNPSGTATNSYKWSQVGKTVFLWIWLRYSVAGTLVNQVDVTLPSELPIPQTNTGGITGEWNIPGMGGLKTTSGNVTNAAAVVSMKYSSASVIANKVTIFQSNGSYSAADIFITYPTP